MKTNKTALSPAELYGLLDREYRRRRPSGCETCDVHMPFRVDLDRSRPGHWEVIRPPDCPLDCRRVIDQVVEELASRYMLAAD